MRILLAHDGSGGAMEAAEMIRDIEWPTGSFLRVISEARLPSSSFTTPPAPEPASER